MSDGEQKPLWKRLVARVLWVSLAVVCLAGGTVVGLVNQSQVGKELIEQSTKNVPPQEVFRKDSITLLVLGCDEDRYYAGAAGERDTPGGITRHASRSDMMLVTKLDFANKRITGLSIPRDMLWQLPGYRKQKINGFHAIGYNKGGPEMAKDYAKKAAEGVVGVKIDRVVVLDFGAFAKMVDLLGGVEVYVPKNMDYDDFAGGLHIHLKQGRQVLGGEDAIGFVRFRHSDSDFQRQARQKDLMMAMKDRALAKWQVAPKIMDESYELLGRALMPKEIASLALFARKVGADNVKMDMVPVIERKGRSTLELDEDKLAEKLEELHMTPSPADRVTAVR